MDLKEECERLTKIGSKGPSEAARAILLDGLHSKWEGVQVTAARALASWGDETSLAAIKVTLMDLSTKTAHWASAGAIANALGHHLGERDIPWVLDFYFFKSKRTNRFSLMSIFSNLPQDKTALAIEHLAQSAHIDPREKENALIALKWYAKARGNGKSQATPSPAVRASTRRK